MIVLPFPENLITEHPGGKRAHQGIDYAVPVGTPVRSAIDGTVVFAADDGSGSLTIDVLRPDGLLMRAGHNSQFRVSVGDSVKVGDIIALSGNTGWSTGPHSHIEFRWDRLWHGGQWLTWQEIQTFVEVESPGSGQNGVENMFMIALKNGAGKETLFAVVGPKFWLEFTGQAAANNLNRQLSGKGGPALIVSRSFWEHCKRSATTGSNK